MDHIFNTLMALVIVLLAFEWGRQGHVRGLAVWTQWTRFALLTAVTVGLVTSANPTLDALGYDKVGGIVHLAATLRIIVAITIGALVFTHYKTPKKP